ncbi:hypothetical protein EI969_18310 [Pseudomonas sp. PB101]|uniref:hypothetical protein n=1 Tax=Pseudomonas sp. PB101 TaxID=2495428 RepID=UPI0013667792|nr:hypothetical protein [Pseudomonas sp. PB101]MVW87873.1 hypothetical protein [Pseudomonas sp. PB101]
MPKPLDIYKESIDSIYKLKETLLEQLPSNTLSKFDTENISNLGIEIKNLSNHISNSPDDTISAINSARAFGLSAYKFASGIAQNTNHEQAAISTANKLSNMSLTLLEKIDSGPFYRPREEYLQGPENHHSNKDSISINEKQLIELKATLESEIKTFIRDISKGSDEIEQLKQRSHSEYKKSNADILKLTDEIEQLKSIIYELNQVLAKELDKAAKITEDAVQSSKDSNDKIHKLLGETATKVLLVDYADTAETENKSANKMRNWSLACMTLTGVFLCISIFESLFNAFDWKQSIFKIFTAIALSVPAAYLARESAKHRNQEHINRRISLDLRAINPYIATLPTDEQNKIKSDVAAKIFGMQENGSNLPDNIPINIQELVKLIIDKIPTQK